MWDSDFKFGKNLPSFVGIRPGKGELRKAEMEAGGMDTIRRVDWTGGDGTKYTLNTRAGMPRVLSHPKKKAIAVGLHGLCRWDGVYADAMTTAHTMPTNFQAPVTGTTRYTKMAPPLSAPYLSNIMDYQLTGSGNDRAPTFNPTRLTKLQWLYVDTTGVVQVLGLGLISANVMSHTFGVFYYGPYRSTTVETPFVAIETIDTFVVTSTETYLTGVLTVRPRGWFCSTGNDETQTVGWGRPGFVGGDTQVTEGSVGTPDHVRTTDDWQVEASPDGRRIAVARGFNFMPQLLELRENQKYTPSTNYTVILTVVEVTLNDSEGTISVGAPVDKFQWQYHFPTDYTATGQVDYIGAESLISDELGATTWLRWYELDNITSAGTPYTLRECMNFCYDKAGVLNLRYVEVDYGPLNESSGRDRSARLIIHDTGVPSTSPAPAALYTVGQWVPKASYVSNGGYGWGAIASRTYFNNTLLHSSTTGCHTYYRLTNNLLLVTYVDGEFTQPSPSTAYPSIYSPAGSYAFTALFPVTTTNSHFVTYNVETDVIASSNNGTGPICWV